MEERYAITHGTRATLEMEKERSRQTREVKGCEKKRGGEQKRCDTYNEDSSRQYNCIYIDIIYQRIYEYKSTQGHTSNQHLGNE